MTTDQLSAAGAQDEALRLARELDENADLDASEGGNPDVCALEWAASRELRRLHARVQELEAQMAAIGAGGVEPLRRQAGPDLARLTARGAAAWAGVDPQALREGREIHQPACWCETCDIAANSGLRSRMSLCPQCGDKRCPRAQQHDNPCHARGAQGESE